MKQGKGASRSQRPQRLKKDAASWLQFIAAILGVGHIARAVVEGHDAVINRLVELARKAGLSERRIAQALRAKKASDRALSVIALLYPYIPNPAILRALAGTPAPARAPRPRRTTMSRRARRPRARA